MKYFPTAHTRFNFGRLFQKPRKSFVLALIHHEFWNSKRKEFRKVFFRTYKYELFDSLVCLSTFVFSAWLMFWTFQYSNHQMIMIGRVWSDFAAHIPLIRSFSMGNNFPPEYPTFPGEPIRYHYLFFLFAAGFEKLGLNIATAVNIPSTLGMWLLLWIIYHTTLTLWKSRKAALLALLLFLFNGTWSVWEILKRSSSVFDFVRNLVLAPEYASFGPWDGKIVSAFWNWNIYINQRHLAASFGIALALCYPLLRRALDKSFILKKRWYPVIYLTVILLPLFHQAAYVMVIGWCLMWGFIFKKRLEKKVLLLYLWSFAFSLLTQFGLTENTKQHAVFRIGYLSTQKTLMGISTYWLFNLGFYCLLIPLGLVFSKRRIFWFFLPFLGFFALANTFQLSTDMINNHKLINYFTIGCNIVLAGFLVVVWKKHWLLKMIVPFLVLAVTLSGIADVFPLINNHFLYQDDYQRSASAMWIKKNTPPHSVFLSNEYIFNPASIVGRKLFLDYGYFNWSMGYPDSERRQLLKTFYSADIPAATLCQSLYENHISYVHLGNVHGNQEYDVKMSTLFTHFTPSYKNDKDEYIFDVVSNCGY